MPIVNGTSRALRELHLNQDVVLWTILSTPAVAGKIDVLSFGLSRTVQCQLMDLDKTGVLGVITMSISTAVW